MTGRPEWASEPLMVCMDGPMAGQRGTADDWAARVEAAEYMLGYNQPRAASLTYSPTGTPVPHPFVEGVTGAAWICHPATTESEDTDDTLSGDHSQEQQLDLDEWWV